MDGFSDPPYLDADRRGDQGRLRPRGAGSRGRCLRAHEHQASARTSRCRSSTSRSRPAFNFSDARRTRSAFRSRSSPAAASSGSRSRRRACASSRRRSSSARPSSINLGVASGSVSVMAGIYFRLESDAAGEESAQLTGYFRMRGEVEALGLVSVLHRALPLAHVRERRPGKAVGRATLTIEVEVAVLLRLGGDLVREEVLRLGRRPVVRRRDGPARRRRRRAVRPWDLYVRAFADD